MKDVEWLEPWFYVGDRPETCRSHEGELQAELAVGHPLFDYRQSAKLIAKRGDCDDVLFRLGTDESKYAVVHLTWSGRTEQDIRWPTADFYAAFEDFVLANMIPENKDR